MFLEQSWTLLKASKMERDDCHDVNIMITRCQQRKWRSVKLVTTMFTVIHLCGFVWFTNFQSSFIHLADGGETCSDIFLKINLTLSDEWLLSPNVLLVPPDLVDYRLPENRCDTGT